MQSKRQFVVILILVAALLTVNAAVLLWPVNQFEIRTVVGPEVSGRYKHASSACELASGEILLVYYSGSAEYGNDTAIFATQMERPSGKWSPPRIVADTTDKADGNPALWKAPEGDIWLFYPVRQGATWSTAQLATKVSKDDGLTWQDVDPPSDQPGLMTRARPITLNDGGCLLPLDFNPSTDTEFVSDESGSLFARSDAEMQHWELTDVIHSRLGNHQPAVAALGDQHLVAYCRRGGDYFGRPDGFLVRSESHDGGRTWSPGKDTQFLNPNSPADFVRLQSGDLLLAFNNNSVDRSTLTLALSKDQDRSYPHSIDIISGEQAYSYPCILETEDASIYLFFTSGARSHIQYVVLSEKDIE